MHHNDLHYQDCLHRAPCTLHGVFEPRHCFVCGYYHQRDPLDFDLHHWCQGTATHEVIWDGSGQIFGRAQLTAAGTGGPTWTVGGRKGGCGQENLQGRSPGGRGNNKSAVHSTDGGLHQEHHTKGWKKKGYKAGTAHGGRYLGGSGNSKRAGQATDGGMRPGPHTELGKKAGGCS